MGCPHSFATWFMFGCWREGGKGRCASHLRAPCVTFFMLRITMDNTRHSPATPAAAMQHILFCHAKRALPLMAMPPAASEGQCGGRHLWRDLTSCHTLRLQGTLSVSRDASLRPWTALLPKAWRLVHAPRSALPLTYAAAAGRRLAGHHSNEPS